MRDRRTVTAASVDAGVFESSASRTPRRSAALMAGDGLDPQDGAHTDTSTRRKKDLMRARDSMMADPNTADQARAFRGFLQGLARARRYGTRLPRTEGPYRGRIRPAWTYLSHATRAARPGQ